MRSIRECLTCSSFTSVIGTSTTGAAAQIVARRCTHFPLSTTQGRLVAVGCYASSLRRVDGGETLAQSFGSSSPSFTSRRLYNASGGPASPQRPLSSRSRRGARHVGLRSNRSISSPSSPPRFASQQQQVPHARASRTAATPLTSTRPSASLPPNTFLSQQILPRGAPPPQMSFSYRQGLTDMEDAFGNETRKTQSSKPSNNRQQHASQSSMRPQQQQQQQPSSPKQKATKLLEPHSALPKAFSVSRHGHGQVSVPGGVILRNAVGISALAVDTAAEQRVDAMLRSDQRRANPGCALQIPEAEVFNVPHTTLKRCVLQLSIPGVSREVTAIGQSTKAKLARALCYMHAEKLLDYFASASESERHAPDAAAWPPPLEEKRVISAAAVPKERDFVSWDDYVDASETYAQETAAQAQHEALAAQQLPPSGHPVADRAAQLVRRHRGRYTHPNALQELNESLRDGSHLIQTAHLASKVFVATLPLDPKSGLTATGVAKNSKDAKRECAAHALCILQLLHEDAEGQSHGSGRRDRKDGKRQNSQQRQQKHQQQQKDKNTSNEQAAAPLEAVLQHLKPKHGKLIRYFRLLFGKELTTPQTVFTRETTASGSLQYKCELTMGDITCTGNGMNRFEAERFAMEDGITELLLYDDRLQALQSFVDTYPSITPESVPSAGLPHQLVEQLHAQLKPVVQRQQKQQQQEAVSEEIAPNITEDDDVDAARRLSQDERAVLQLSERAFASDAFHAARMKDDLMALRQNLTYLTKFHPRRSTLAMASVKAQLLNAVAHHRVTVVCGTTGCGKTTQVPQYILDHEIEQGRGGACNILVTQPRRLSSFSVAERIAQERLSSIGTDVGYAVRLDARPGRHITVCTTGVLLQIFSTHPKLEHVSHLIIDEVHERDINCDVVLALVKELLVRNPLLRVVLMSATMQSEMFAHYFGADTPVIRVEGAVYPVSVRYLEDIATEAASVQFYSPNFDVVPQALTPSSSPSSVRQQQPQRAKLAHTLLRHPPKTDYNLIAYLVHRAVQVDLGNDTAGKSILVFLPGWKELMSTKVAIEKYRGVFAADTPATRFHIILLHSTVDSAKQRECFMPSPPGTVKVVLATNIAESGITIDDAVVVIDTGLIKTTTWVGRPTTGAGASHASTPTLTPTSNAPSPVFVPLDSISGEQSTPAHPPTATTPVFSTQLTCGYASQANGTQRKGRAGRTQSGVCYRLFTRELWEALPAFPEADIHRVPLTQVLLKLLSLGYAHPKATLQTFLEPPSSTNVEVSMQLLSGIGAVNAVEQLTPLGEYLAKLPCDPRIGKMIIIGAVLQCLDSVLTVAACVDVSPYVTSRDHSAAARKKRHLFARGSQSDHISFLNAYNAYCANGESAEFARFNSLHAGNLRVISKYKAQYRDILQHAGLIANADGRGEWKVRDDADGALPGRAVAPAFASQQGVAAPKDARAGGHDTGESACLLLDTEDDNDDDHLSGHQTPMVAALHESASPTLVYSGELCVDTSALSRNSFDVALVKACVCAALFPNVAVLRPPPLHVTSSLKRRRLAEKVDLRTKHFTSIKPSKESACRRVGGPREHSVPDCVELLEELHHDMEGAGSPTTAASSATGALSAATATTTAAKPVPAFFYIFQDVFGVKDARQEFLTTLSSVSLWALLLFGASESTTHYYGAVSLCVIDGWIALHVDKATYELVTELRQALYECLRRKYHHPQDPQNNAALRTVTEVCRRVLKSPVLTDGTAENHAGATTGGNHHHHHLKDDDTAAMAAGRPSAQLVDTGSIIDPLVHERVRVTGKAVTDADAGVFSVNGVAVAADGDEEDDEEDEDASDALRAGEAAQSR